MINELILQGFKRHRGNTKLPLAPITLLLGSNSAGKSSVFQSLLVLKQTLESGAAGITSLVTDGARAELGAFDNVVNGGLEGAARSATQLPKIER
jgi:predicted ATPase